VGLREKISYVVYFEEENKRTLSHGVGEWWLALPLLLGGGGGRVPSGPSPNRTRNYTDRPLTPIQKRPTGFSTAANRWGRRSVGIS